MAQSAAYRPRLGASHSRDPSETDGLGRLRLLTILAGVALVIEVICVPFTSPRFAVREIILRGDPKVTEIVARRVALPRNTNFFRAPTRLMAKRALAIPAVQAVRVARSFPNRLVVTVERREAVAVVRRAEDAILVDPDGVVFAIRDEWGWGLPELVGSNLAKDKIAGAKGKAELSELLGVLRALGPDPRLRVARLELIGGQSIEATLESGAKVRLGDADQLDVKIKLLSSVLDRLGADRVEYIDLSDPWTAYWRPRAGGL